MALGIAAGVSLNLWGACREQPQMAPGFSMDNHWAGGRLEDVRGTGSSSSSSAVALSSTSQPPVHLNLNIRTDADVLSASSSVKLAAAHRNRIFRATGWAARQEALELPGDWNSYIPFFLNHRKFLTFLIFFPR